MIGGMAAVRSPGGQEADRNPGGQEADRSPGGIEACRNPGGQAAGRVAGRSPGIPAGVDCRGTKQTGKCVGLTKGVIEYQIALTYTPWRIFPNFKEGAK